MTLSALTSHLLIHSDRPVAFRFADGDSIPDHFHITEVGHVRKRFIDCGGTVRQTDTVQLQVWLGSDSEHRLTAGKLARILEQASEVLPAEDLEVEVEYEGASISQHPIQGFDPDSNQAVFILGEKHTDCLAKAECGTNQAADEASACCGKPAGCC